jgi:hypothetical protein
MSFAVRTRYFRDGLSRRHRALGRPRGRWLNVPMVAHTETGSIIREAGDWFRVVPPYGADVRAGDEAGPETQYPRNNLWAGMRWMPPEIPAAPDSPGTYHAWHRVYDARTGRWTSPDPAATPWWNLQDYVGGQPLTATDPTGLDAASRAEADKDYNGRQYGCKVEVYYAAFIPYEMIDDPTPNLSPNRRNFRFTGDNRTYVTRGKDVIGKSRAWQKVTVNLCSDTKDSYEHGTGATTRVYEQQSVELAEVRWQERRETKQADTSRLFFRSWTKSKCSSEFYIHGFPLNPFIPEGPGISWSLKLSVTWKSTTRAEVKIVHGLHSLFPGMEVIANDTNVWGYNPKDRGRGPWAIVQKDRVTAEGTVGINCPCCACECSEE